MKTLQAAVTVVLLGCGPAPVEAPGAVTAPSASAMPSTVEGAGSAIAPAATSPALMSSAMRGTSPACAFVSLGFDSRALPTNTSADGFASWVRGQADNVRRAAPAGTSPRMFTEGGSVHGLFDGATEQEVLARCEQTLKAYLPTAPNLPLIGSGSAVHVLIPCRPCQ